MQQPNHQKDQDIGTAESAESLLEDINKIKTRMGTYPDTLPSSKEVVTRVHDFAQQATRSAQDTIGGLNATGFGLFVSCVLCPCKLVQQVHCVAL